MLKIDRDAQRIRDFPSLSQLLVASILPSTTKGRTRVEPITQIHTPLSI